MRTSFAAGVLALFMTATSVFGGYMVTQTAAPGFPPLNGPYITFDEPNVPTGFVGDPFTFYQNSDDVIFTSGNGLLVVAPNVAATGGLGSGNQLEGGFQVNMTFTQPVDALTFQGWATGSANPPFGGWSVVVRDQNGNSVFQTLGNPGVPFGGAGNEWFNVRADGGDNFWGVTFFNGAFNSFSSYVDNVNFRVVPEPNALGLGLLASLAGLAFRRRR